jgi:hypothetical protein
MTRFSTLLLVVLLNFNLAAQEIASNNYRLEPNKQPVTFSKRMLNEMGGQGFQMNPKFKLKHAFYGDTPGSPFRDVGNWEIRNDSVIFKINPGTLTKRYGYKTQERFSTVSLTYTLFDELKSNSITSQIVILNDGTYQDKFLDQMNAIISKYLNEIDKEAIWVIDERADNINQRLRNFLTEQGLFSSFETDRKSNR